MENQHRRMVTVRQQRFSGEIGGLPADGVLVETIHEQQHPADAVVEFVKEHPVATGVLILGALYLSSR